MCVDLCVADAIVTVVKLCRRLPERKEGWDRGHVLKLPDWREVETFRLALAPPEQPEDPGPNSTGLDHGHQCLPGLCEDLG